MRTRDRVARAAGALGLALGTPVAGALLLQHAPLAFGAGAFVAAPLLAAAVAYAGAWASTAATGRQLPPPPVRLGRGAMTR